MKTLFLILLGTLQFMFSYSNVDSAKEGERASSNTTAYINYTVNPEELLKSFMSWYKYTYNNIKLSDDFVGLDTNSSIIKKVIKVSLNKTNAQQCVYKIVAGG